MSLRILLLAGTFEARMLADALFDMRDVWAVASMAGATRNPEPLALPCRIGGFGGDSGFATYLTAHAIDTVVDATHPFAHRVSARTATVCADLGVRYVQVLRPEWTQGEGDKWTLIQREEEAANHIPRDATVFLATGRQTLHRFANLSDRRLICRQIDRPDAPFPFPRGEYLVGRPPFSERGEAALFRRLGIDWLVVKNAGGGASRAKLDAARRLGLPVAMIARPPQPPGADRVPGVDAALQWIKAHR